MFSVSENSYRVHIDSQDRKLSNICDSSHSLTFHIQQSPSPNPSIAKTYLDSGIFFFISPPQQCCSVIISCLCTCLSHSIFLPPQWSWGDLLKTQILCHLLTSNASMSPLCLPDKVKSFFYCGLQVWYCPLDWPQPSTLRSRALFCLVRCQSFCFQCPL